jgi:hypothetical protein
MKKRFQNIMLSILGLGQLIFVLSSIFRNSLTDFALGFCEGISIVGMTTGFIYFCWCFAKKKNPYRIE